MRIIAGEFRGRRLLAPETDATRPITDRVKQSLFDILSPRIEGSIVYDCFAGTGSMGLECLSRGADKAVFFELERSAVARLRKNIAAVGVEDRAQVVAGDVFRYDFTKSALPEAGITFLDPPYRFLREQPDRVRALAEQLMRKLKSDGVLVFRHDADDRLDLPGLARYDERTYGGMVLEFLRLAKADGTAPA